MPEVVSPPKGTRPEGAHSEADAGRKVREMFTQIAPRYDLLNHLLSLELDRLWRARAARLVGPILQRSNAFVLDLCCGTGDLAFALARHGPARLVGADFSHAMLVRANEKPAGITPKATGDTSLRARFIEADALRLPFPDCSFDLVASAFGFRNLVNYEDGLKEIRRVLKPGGTLAILEFTEPPPGFLGDLYRWYCRKLLPRIGGLISGNPGAYKYLPASVSRFFGLEELAVLMRKGGFDSVEYRLWTLKTVAFYIAVKSERL
jgi:demethylmenaquinone methyltransferase / 2-methoxy-6-polyprenyl-1,4-benzoquinol methylase